VNANFLYQFYQWYIHDEKNATMNHDEPTIEDHPQQVPLGFQVVNKVDPSQSLKSAD
jgi:hypothetical protein